MAPAPPLSLPGRGPAQPGRQAALRWFAQQLQQINSTSREQHGQNHRQNGTQTLPIGRPGE